MLKTIAKIAFLALIPVSIFATPKGRETRTIQVVSTTTNIHRSPSGDIFSYTDLMVIQLRGQTIVYECAQRGDICPVVEAGKTYTVDREGVFIYVPMNSQEGKTL